MVPIADQNPQNAGSLAISVKGPQFDEIYSTRWF